MEALKRFLEKLRSSDEVAWPAISLEEAGFRTRERLVLWSEITRIAAFKRDMLTIDDIWFQLDTADEPIMVCEEQPGFKEWQVALSQQYPAVYGWQDKIVQPPFAE